MNVIVLSKSPWIYSTEIILKELNRRGIEAKVINPLECNVHIEGNNSFVLYEGKLIDKTDFIIPRIGSASHFYGLYVVQALEEKGFKVLNSYKGLLNCRNKLIIYNKLVQCKLPTAKTTLVKTTQNLDYILNNLNGFPIIIKLTRGSQGKGVMIADNINTLRSIIDTMSLLEEDIILQEYFETSPKYSDIRVYVLNKSVIGATQRINFFDFRSNTHCGGTMKLYKINPLIENIALKAASYFDLNFCSIDFLITDGGPKIIEINSTPGFEKVETEAGFKISSLLADYIEHKLCTTNIKT